MISKLLLIGIVASCGEIIERDISNQEVILVAPGNGIEVDSGRVAFFWEKLEDIDHYNLQIVSGDFDSPDLLILDTNVVINKVIYQLDSGQYSWGVRAQNYYYSTLYSTRSLTISKRIFDKGTIQLLFPQNNQVLTDTAFQFNWNPVNGVDSYIFKLRKASGTEEIIGTKNAFVLKAFKREVQDFEWEVIGVEEDEGLIFESPVYSFTIDPEL